jgi:hypothetical protein
LRYSAHDGDGDGDGDGDDDDDDDGIASPASMCSAPDTHRPAINLRDAGSARRRDAPRLVPMI